MYFFFFKQKTAYEMRISDWSSDVCSSDLQTSLLGEYFLALVPEGEGKLAPGSVIPLERTRRAAELEAIVSQAGALTAQVNIDNVNRILTSVDTGFAAGPDAVGDLFERSEEHTSELQSLMRISYAVFCLKKK